MDVGEMFCSFKIVITKEVALEFCPADHDFFFLQIVQHLSRSLV